MKYISPITSYMQITVNTVICTSAGGSTTPPPVGTKVIVSGGPSINYGGGTSVIGGAR